jgi:hypothetical protein
MTSFIRQKRVEIRFQLKLDASFFKESARAHTHTSHHMQRLIGFFLLFGGIPSNNLLAQPELEFDQKNRGGNMTEHVGEANKKNGFFTEVVTMHPPSSTSSRRRGGEYRARGPDGRALK